MKKKLSYSRLTAFMVVALVVINSLLLTYKIFYRTQPTYPHKSVLGFTYPPEIPDFSANSGGVKTLGNVTAIVAENTFSYDTYFWVNPRPKETPVFILGYFQISDMYDAWMRKQSDSSKIVYPSKKYIVSITYNESWLFTDQNVLFPENSIKVAYAPSYNGPWTLLSTAINTDQNTAGTITDKGGFYMLVAGFGTLLPTATPTVTPTATPTLVLNTPTVTPTATPTTAPTQIAQTIEEPTVQPTISKKPTPTIIQQRITVAKATLRRKSFLDRIIDALLLIFTEK